MSRMKLSSEEIRVYIVERLSGVISPEDDAMLTRLIGEEEAVRRQWLALSEEMRDAEQMGFEKNVDLDERWRGVEGRMRMEENMASKTGKSRQENARRKRKPVVLIRSLVAAAVVLGLVAGYWMLGGKKDKLVQEPAAAKRQKCPTLQYKGGQVIALAANGKSELPFWKPGVLKVPEGCNYELKLPDGTGVVLNAASELKFGDSLGMVDIKGEAFFKVIKDHQRPFIVRARGTDIVVLGTSFNVNTYDTNNIRTALVSGAVATRGQCGTDIRLKPGFEASFQPGKGFTLRPFDSLRVLSWMSGVYYYQNAPLQELAGVIKRWYDIDSEFADSKIAAKTFSGELRRKQPLETFLENLNLSGPVRAQLANKKVYFR